MNGQIIHAAQPPLLCVTDTSASLVLNQYDFDAVLTQVLGSVSESHP